MPRPKSRDELLTASNKSFAQLDSMISALTLSQRNSQFSFEHRDRNIRDVLAHLHEWHLMMLTWYEIGMAGSTPEMPAKGYTWRQTPQLNAAIWNKNQSKTLPYIRKRLASSHKKLTEIIAAHTDAELFERHMYPWTGTSTLGSYLTSSTSSHYNWAIKLIRRFERTLNDAPNNKANGSRRKRAY